MRNKDFIILAFFTLVTVLLWMFFELLHTANKSTITPVVAEQIKPIVPHFDTKLLLQLKERQK